MFSREFRHKLRLHLKDTTFTHHYEHLMRVVRFGKKMNAFTGKITIADVGAYDGLTAAFFHSVFPEATIHAFEPNPQAYALLEANTKHIPSIRLYTEALSDVKGAAPLYVTLNGVSSSINPINSEQLESSGGLQNQLKVEKTVDIHLVDLDSLNIGPITILKLDTQGNEVRVINGAKNTLKNTKFIVTEMSVHKMYDNGCSYFETDAALRACGFTPIDFIVPSRKDGVQMMEFDAIYMNTSLVSV